MEELYLDAARKLARTEDPQTSKDAAKRMVDSGELNRQENMVYDEIVRYVRMLGEDFTTKDIAKQLKGSPFLYYKNYDICRKRFSGLFNKGKIEPIQRTADVLGKTYKVAITKSGNPAYERRDGCRVFRLL